MAEPKFHSVNPIHECWNYSKQEFPLSQDSKIEL